MPSSPPLASSYKDEIELSEAEAESEQPNELYITITITAASNYPIYIKAHFKSLLTAIRELKLFNTDLSLPITKLKKAVKSSQPPPAFHNSPALVEKVATFTTRLTELHKASLLKILKTLTTPAPPPAANRGPHHHHLNTSPANLD